MALEQFRVQIAMLMDEIAKAPEGAHELHEQVREKLSEMEALGLPLPEDLVDLEQFLEKRLDSPRTNRGAGTPPEG